MTIIQEAVRVCAERGEEFWGCVIVTAHNGGIVHLGPECVLIVQRESDDCLFVWLAMGVGYLPKLLDLAPPGTKWLKWQRGIRLADRAEIGQFSFERVRRLASIPSSHEFPRKEESGSSRGVVNGSAAGHGVV